MSYRHTEIDKYWEYSCVKNGFLKNIYRYSIKSFINHIKINKYSQKKELQ